MIESNVYNTILDLHNHHNIVNFLSGSVGNFDAICETQVLILKKTYPEVKLFLVIPYLTKDINNNPLNYKYDEIICPDFEKQYHERNKWLVNHSDYIIANVTKDYGGALKTLKYAKKMAKRIVSVSST